MSTLVWFFVPLAGLAAAGLSMASGPESKPAPSGTPAAGVTARGYTIHTLTTAPATSRPILQGILDGFTFIPNIHAVYAESPALLKSAVASDEAVGASTLTPVERNFVLIVAARELGSGYCVPGHCTVAKGMGMNDDAIKAVRSGKAVNDARLDALGTFTAEVIATRGKVSDERLASFLAAGFTRANTLDVLALIGQKTVSTYAFNMTGVPLDDAFKPQAWTR